MWYPINVIPLSIWRFNILLIRQWLTNPCLTLSAVHTPFTHCTIPDADIPICFNLFLLLFILDFCFFVRGKTDPYIKGYGEYCWSIVRPEASYRDKLESPMSDTVRRRVRVVYRRDGTAKDIRTAVTVYKCHRSNLRRQQLRARNTNFQT